MQRFMRRIIIILVVLVALCYFCLIFFYQDEDSKYLDTVDAITVANDYIYSVGLNNNNDRNLEKAKYTMYDMNQEKVMEKIYNKGYSSRFYDLVSDDGDVVIVGSYEATKKDYKNNLDTALILKYSDDGQVLFEKDLDMKNSSFRHIVKTSDGYIAVGTGKEENSQRGIIVKYHRDGTVDWKKVFDQKKDVLFSSAVVYDDTIYVVGVQNHHGILASFDMKGNNIDYVIDKTTDSFGYSSLAVVDDTVVVTTGKKENNIFSPTLVQYDLDLSYLDDVSYSTEFSGRFHTILKDSNNDLIVLGEMIEHTNKKDIHSSYIGKYRSDLTEAEVVPYYNDGDNYFTDVYLVDDAYLVSGYSYYSKEGYLGKLLVYSKALKMLEVK